MNNWLYRLCYAYPRLAAWITGAVQMIGYVLFGLVIAALLTSGYTFK